jgi:hypothetical protein
MLEFVSFNVCNSKNILYSEVKWKWSESEVNVKWKWSEVNVKW